MFKKAFAATPIQKAKFELRKLFSAFALAAAALSCFFDNRMSASVIWASAR